jgi:hypothetical protein
MINYRCNIINLALAPLFHPFEVKAARNAPPTLNTIPENAQS